MRNTTGILTLALGVLAATPLLMAQAPDVKPGPEHEFLKQSAGAWEITAKGGGGDSKGEVVCKIALNGLWLLEEVKMDIGGATFEGRGATSYDPAKKKFVNVWIDSMSTSPMVTEGTFDKSTKTLTLVGDMAMPDGKTVKATLTTVYKSADAKTFTLRAAGPDGKEFEMVHIDYKRRTK